MELYPGARRTLRELATNPKYREVKIVVASRSLEPAYSRACIDGIKVAEGVTMGDMIHEELGACRTTKCCSLTIATGPTTCATSTGSLEC